MTDAKRTTRPSSAVDPEVVWRATGRWTRAMSREALADLEARPDEYLAAADQILEGWDPDRLADLVRAVADASDEDLAALRAYLLADPPDADR